MANSQDILEVKEEAPLNTLLQFRLAHQRYVEANYNMEKYIPTLQEAFKDNKELVAALNNMLFPRTEGSTIDIELLDNVPPSSDPKWQRFLELKKRVSHLENQMKQLEEKCSTKVLEGVDAQGKPIKVKEKNNPFNPAFEWTYVNGKDEPTMKLTFFGSHFTTRTKYEKGKGQAAPERSLS